MADVDDFDAADAALRGDLRPLAAYLRAGGEITDILREELALAIEWGTFEPSRKAAERKSAAALRRRQRHQRDLGVGAFIACREHLTERASLPRIYLAAAKTWQVTERTAERCYKDFRKLCVEQPDSFEAFEARGEYWAAMREFCAERGLDFYAVYRSRYSGQNLDLKF